MADLFWPGDERALLAFDQGSFLESMVEVEVAWLQVLRQDGAPALEEDQDVELVTSADLEQVALGAEAGGNPVIPLVALMRARLRERGAPEAAEWLHRGLTSQDVMDTAMVLCARATAGGVLHDLDGLVVSLVTLADRHRDDPMMGRTLTQHAQPIPFGLKAAHWLQGVLDARDQVRQLRWPGQFAGPVGVGLPRAADACVVLGLDDVPPWHTVRTPFTRYADALVATTDALGHVADDVLVGARSEIGELAEPAAEGRGGSSSMPHKQNPVLSVLIRRAALTLPGLAAQVHLAGADTRDERPDGAWHTEWSALATMSRRALVATSQAAELVGGLRVDTARMAALAGDDLPGDTGQTIDRILHRARESTP
jgi:3-carboxy-cis,cis-muconate cycloisomerase